MHNIHRGIYPPEEKSLSNPGEVIDAGLPEKLLLPLSQPLDTFAIVSVEVNDHVLGGYTLAHGRLSTLTVPIHAPTSGIITAIKRHPVPHLSGQDDWCIELACDHEDQWLPLTGNSDWHESDPAELIHNIHSAGITGMGGAGFPTAIKLLARDKQVIHTLIINGAECEPYITADDTLMQINAAGIVEGAEIIAYILGVETIIFGIEDNKPIAIKAMKDAVATCKNNRRYEVVTIPTKYPSGGEKQLIEILTGKQVPSDALPADIGIICQNPGTAVAVRDAILNGKPLTDRIVTVTGRALAKPGNYRVQLGTPINHLLHLTDFDPSNNQRLIHGGPMMGFPLKTADTPVIKKTNCILVPTEQELPIPPPAQACIRCGLCSEVCPASLLPQQLYWYARAKDNEQLENHRLFSCIECGACSWVCPSRIPLVQHYRAAKTAVINAYNEHERSDKARARFEARSKRLERETAEREAIRAKRKATAQKETSGTKEDDPIAAAIARVNAKKAKTNKANS